MRQVVVSELGTILFYSGIHFKPLKYVTNREDPNRHIPQEIKEFASLALAGRYTPSLFTYRQYTGTYFVSSPMLSKAT